jgi:hypothetical protein
MEAFDDDLDDYDSGLDPEGYTPDESFGIVLLCSMISLIFSFISVMLLIIVLWKL